MEKSIFDKIVQDIELKGWSYQQNIVDNKFLMSMGDCFNQEFRPARVGKNQTLQLQESIRGDWIYWIDPLNPPDRLKFFIQFLQSLKHGLNEAFYMGLRDFECHLAKYPIGSFYKKHLDRFEQDSSRGFSFIFYLHSEWNEEDGGELVLYDKMGNILETILPRPGSFMCFLPGEFPHEVKTAHRERRSLTGWIHTKDLT
jgi:SM-20-related protein